MLGFLFEPTRPAFYRGGSVSTTELHLATEQVSRQLNRRIESLELACAGLWELLKSKHGYSDEELVEAVRQIDLKDGVEDGRLRLTDEVCPSCGRKLLTRSSPKCSWCGAELDRGPL